MTDDSIIFVIVLVPFLVSILAAFTISSNRRAFKRETKRLHEWLTKIERGEIDE